MEHLAFYNAGCEPGSGPAGLKVRIRRRLREILLPMFLRLVEILGSICHRLLMTEQEIQNLHRLTDDLRRRQEEQAARIPATIAFGWDYVAMVRRLAVLEEHVDALLASRDAAGHSSGLAELPGRHGFEAESPSRAKVG